MTDDDIRLAKERLMKLWDAYESQELELQAATRKISDLDSKHQDKDRVIETLRELVESKDQELRKLEITYNSIERETNDFRKRLDETTTSLNQERSRYKKLFVITQELERDVDRLTKEVDERDRWFRDNMSFFEEFPTRVGKRLGMASKPRKSLIDELEEEPPSVQPVKDDIETNRTTTFQRVDPREETKKDFLDIPGIDEERADILIKAGYGSTEELKKASPFELVKLEGITPTVARKITDHLKE